MMKKYGITLLLAAALFLTGAKEAYAISNDYIDIEAYKGLAVSLAKTQEITDEAIEQEIESVLTANATQESVLDRNAQSGDWVSIDYTCFIDGVAYAGATGANRQIRLGEEAVFTGFDTQIIGHGVGEQFEFELAFPADYEADPSKASVTARWVVTMNALYTLTLPEFSDSFVQNTLGIDGVSTAEAYRDYIRQQLEEAEAIRVRTENLHAAYAAVEEKTTVKAYPEAKLSAAIEAEEALVSQSADNAGKSLSDYLTETYGETEEAFEARIREEAESDLKQELIFTAIAEEEALSVTAADYEENLELYAKENGFSGGEEMTALYSEDEIRAGMLQEKVLTFILEHANEAAEPSAPENEEEAAGGLPSWGKAGILILLMLAAGAGFALWRIRRRRKSVRRL